MSKLTDILNKEEAELRILVNNLCSQNNYKKAVMEADKFLENNPSSFYGKYLFFCCSGIRLSRE